LECYPDSSKQDTDIQQRCGENEDAIVIEILALLDLAKDWSIDYRAEDEGCKDAGTEAYAKLCEGSCILDKVKVLCNHLKHITA